jgi:uncharacterized protein YprB with RNaseH-like and TPR domain
MASLSDKLQSLGVKLGARDLPPTRPRRKQYAVEQVIPGRFQRTPQGELFVVERHYPADHRHGRAELRLAGSLQMIAEWAGERRLAEAPPAAFAFLDTETTGLSGGTGTYAFLIGVGRLEDDQFHLAQFFMRDPLEEPLQLAALADFLRPCEVLVTFNGKAFDVPLLNTRYVTNGLASPLAAPAQLDLLPLARRLWRDRLPSRALGQLEVHILQAARTHEDVPGWLIPTVYFDYLRSGDARPLGGVFYHNAMDVLAMAGLLHHIGHQLTHPLDGRVEHGLDLVAMAKLFEALSRFEQAVQLYLAGLEGDLPEESYWDALQRLSFLHKRQGNWPAAIELWQQAAAGKQLYAHVELAKFYEHQARELRQAAHWTETALTITDHPSCPRPVRRQWRPALAHRLARLQRKMNRHA